MIGAYHYVIGGPSVVDLIADQGFIAPAIEHQLPLSAAKMCKGFVQDLINRAQIKSKDHIVPKALRAMDELMKERLSVFQLPIEGEDSDSETDWLYVPEDPWARKKEASWFRCPDLLAGDLKNVFLLAGTWSVRAITPREHVSGFVFDAMELIDHGAHLRPADLLSGYEKAIARFITNPKGPHSPMALARLLEKVKKDGVLVGEEAKDRLLSTQYDDFGYAEVVFPGRLGVDGAVEVWKDGVQVWTASPELVRTEVLPRPGIWFRED